MTPFFQQDLATIYRGDCLDVLDEIDLDEIDLVLMDPPYASGARTEAKKSSSGAMMRGQRWGAKPIENDQMTTTGFVWLIRAVMDRLIPAMKDGAAVLCFIDWRQWPNLVGALESKNLRVNSMIVWDKVSMGLGNGFRAQHELICFASIGTPRICLRDCGNVIQCKRALADDHPSPKPEPLLARLIEVLTEPGDLIVDPFAGSGSTIAAARKLGRRSIGIETSEDYCRVAADRCRQLTLL